MLYSHGVLGEKNVAYTHVETKAKAGTFAGFPP
jgi:hypothetical protein